MIQRPQLEIPGSRHRRFRYKHASFISTVQREQRWPEYWAIALCNDRCFQNSEEKIVFYYNFLFIFYFFCSAGEPNRSLDKRIDKNPISGLHLQLGLITYVECLVNKHRLPRSRVHVWICKWGWCMIASPQCCSTSLHWRGALHMLGLEESVSIETQTTVTHGLRGRFGKCGFLFWGTMTLGCTGAVPQLTTSSRGFECCTADTFFSHLKCIYTTYDENKYRYSCFKGKTSRLMSVCVCVCGVVTLYLL